MFRLLVNKILSLFSKSEFSLKIEPIKSSLTPTGVLLFDKNPDLVNYLRNKLNYTEVHSLNTPIVSNDYSLDRYAHVIEYTHEKLIDKRKTAQLLKWNKWTSIDEFRMLLDEDSIKTALIKFMTDVPDSDGIILNVYSIYTPGATMNPETFQPKIPILIRFKITTEQGEPIEF